MLLGELKRLLGSPLRLFSTLICVLVPLALSLAVGADLLQTWIYSTKPGTITKADPRQSIFFVDCISHNQACTGTAIKMRFWPFTDAPLYPVQPAFGIGLFIFAFTAFVSIGNPRIKTMSRTLALAFGFKGRPSKAAKQAAQLITQDEDQARQLEDLTTRHKLEEIKQPTTTILGRTYERVWNRYLAVWHLARNGQMDCFLTERHLSRSLLAVAPTRSGKTYNLVTPIVYAARRSDWAAIVFDPKGDDFIRNIFHASFSMLPDESETSIRLCLIDPELEPGKAAEQLAEGLIKEGKEAFFHESAREAFRAYMLGHRYAQGKFPELADILEYLGNERKSKGLISNLEKILYDEAKDDNTRLKAQDAINMLTVAESRRQSKGDVLGGLYNALLPFGTHPYREYLTTDPTQGVSVREMVIKKLVVRIALTSDEGDLGKALGRLIITQFTSYVLSPRCDRRFLKLIVVDETHKFMCDALRKGLPESAGRNAGYILALQSLAQIVDKQDQSIIFGNAKNKFVFAGVEPSDAEMFAKFYGDLELEYVGTSSNINRGTSINRGISTSISTNRNSGSSNNSGVSSTSNGQNRGSGSGKSKSLTEGTAENTGESTGENINHKIRKVWLEREITTIPRFHAVCTLDDGKGKALPEPKLIEFVDMNERTEFNNNPAASRTAVAIEPSKMVKTAISQLPKEVREGWKLGDETSELTDKGTKGSSDGAADSGSPPKGRIKVSKMPGVSWKIIKETGKLAQKFDKKAKGEQPKAEQNVPTVNVQNAAVVGETQTPTQATTQPVTDTRKIPGQPTSTEPAATPSQNTSQVQELQPEKTNPHSATSPLSPKQEQANAGSSPQTAANPIVSEIRALLVASGIYESEADNLAKIIIRHNRDANYIKGLLSELENSKGVLNKTSVLAFRIKRLETQAGSNQA